MNSKTFKVLFVCCLILSLLTGCGSSETGSENGDPNMNQSEIQNAPADADISDTDSAVLSAHELAYAAVWKEGWPGTRFNPDAEGPAYDITLSINPDASAVVRKVVAPDFSEEYNTEVLLERVAGYQALTQEGQFVCDLNGKFLLARLSDGYTYVMEREDPNNIGSIPTVLSGKWYTEDQSAYYILNPDSSLSGVPMLFSADHQLLVDTIFQSDNFSKMIFTEDSNVLYIDVNSREARNMGELYTFKAMPFVLNGDTLTITSYDGAQVVLTRGD